MATNAGVRLLRIVFVFTLVFSVCELFAGIASNSLLLLEESVHMFADSVSFGISLWAEMRLEKGDRSNSQTANLIGSGISLVTLAFTMTVVFLESLRRLRNISDHGVVVDSGIMLIFGVVLSCFHLTCLFLYFKGFSVHGSGHSHGGAGSSSAAVIDSCEIQDSHNGVSSCNHDSQHGDSHATHYGGHSHVSDHGHSHEAHHTAHHGHSHDGRTCTETHKHVEQSARRLENHGSDFRMPDYSAPFADFQMRPSGSLRTQKRSTDSQGGSSRRSPGKGTPVSDAFKGNHHRKTTIDAEQGKSFEEHSHTSSHGNCCSDHNDSHHSDSSGTPGSPRRRMRNAYTLSLNQDVDENPSLQEINLELPAGTSFVSSARVIKQPRAKESDSEPHLECHGHSHGHGHSDEHHGSEEPCSHGHSHSCCGIDHTSLNMASAVFHIFIDFLHSFFVVVTAIILRLVTNPESSLSGTIDAFASLILAAVIGGGVFILGKEFSAQLSVYCRTGGKAYDGVGTSGSSRVGDEHAHDTGTPRAYTEISLAPL